MKTYAANVKTREVVGAIATAVVLVLAGCSSLTNPAGPEGTVTLVFDFASQQTPGAVSSGAPARPGASAFAPPVIDSVGVAIFRAGGGFETRKGEPVPGVGSVAVTLSCVAEDNKKVSIELFYGGVMTHHGVNLDVDVRKDATTDVLVDAYDFLVPGLAVIPGVIADGENLLLAWNSAQAAASYKVQASSSASFETIEWEGSVVDTVTTVAPGPGLHYFRVAPTTPYALGTFTPSQPAYVVGGGLATAVTGLDVTEAIPGEDFTIYGENLDYPGTRVFVGPTLCQVVSWSWDELVVTLARGARTGYVFVESPLDGGAIYWGGKLGAQRIAFVSATGVYASEYKRDIEAYPGYIEESRVAIIPAAELDWRDMSAFDVIVVAHDMGTNGFDWGERNPARAGAIATSGANILAVGLGGAVYLALVTDETAGLDLAGAIQHEVHVPNESVPIFLAPIDLGLQDKTMIVYDLPRSMIALAAPVGQLPVGVQLLAELTEGSNEWVLLDFVAKDGTGGPKNVRHIFWGFADDPTLLDQQGEHCLANVVSELYSTVAPVPPVATR